MRIILIRHGKTVGNVQKRYIGKTDESLCTEGISELAEREYPETEIVISSPLKRCIETAEIIYPDTKTLVYENLRECDFGDFEGKNYSELNGNEAYQRWIDSGGTLPFPNGESHEAFNKRCADAFEEAVFNNCASESIAFVIHGGTIMAILEKFAVPKGRFYDFQVENGCGFIAELDGKALKIVRRIC
ncbi:MAG: histidine phosphatase family protein [Ruminococcus flavefaciens]|nr:histidine phosphatase family protein [Ruminococcus flavefaciens]MCM1059944.1 histidine phosphatase family protein [Eubacterium sp.]